MDKIKRENLLNGDIVEMTPKEFVDLLNCSSWVGFKPFILNTLKQYEVFVFYDFEFTFTYETMVEVFELEKVANV